MDSGGAYDGEAHGISVDVTEPSSGATVAFGTKEGTYDMASSPTITDVEESPLTVYYQVTADGYETMTGSATVTLSAAEPETPTNIKAYCGQTLSDVSLPSGWSWAKPKTNIETEGETTFKANYRSTSSNYSSMTDVDVPVTVKDGSSSSMKATFYGSDEDFTIGIGKRYSLFDILEELGLEEYSRISIAWGFDTVIKDVPVELTSTITNDYRIKVIKENPVGSYGIQLYFGPAGSADTPDPMAITIGYHDHVGNRTLTVEDNSATLSCSDKYCPYYHGNTFEAKIEAETGEYRGKTDPFEALLTSDMPEDEVTVSKVSYYKEDEPVQYTPYEVGAYRAEATIELKGEEPQTISRAFEITKAPLTITAGGWLTYGQSYKDDDAHVGIICEGFKDGDDKDNSLDLSGLRYWTEYQRYDSVGEYDMEPDRITSQNYDIDLACGKFKVYPKPVQLVWYDEEEKPVTAGTDRRTYNGRTHVLTARVVGADRNGRIFYPTKSGEHVDTVLVETYDGTYEEKDSNLRTRTDKYVAHAAKLNNDNYTLSEYPIRTPEKEVASTYQEWHIDPLRVDLAWSPTSLVFNKLDQWDSVTARISNTKGEDEVFRSTTPERP